jgi:glycosyltransferase involved in cell wall biosynthesis
VCVVLSIFCFNLYSLSSYVLTLFPFAAVKSRATNELFPSLQQETSGPPGLNDCFLPTVHIPPKDILPFQDRQDIVFIGGFQHTPNVDAAIFLTNEILPSIKKQIKNVKLFIVGSNPPDQVKALASEDTIVTGYVPDIAPYFERFKVMIAPIRYGAGIRGKITESMSFGLPVVTTTLGAEGLDMIEGDSILIANSPEEFASKTAKVYTDKDLWNKISANSRELATKRYCPENVLEMFRILFSSTFLASAEAANRIIKKLY